MKRALNNWLMIRWFIRKEQRRLHVHWQPNNKLSLVNQGKPDYNQQYIANQQQVTKQSLTTKQGVVTSPQQAQQAVTNQFDSSSYKQTSGTNQQTTSNRVHQTSYQQGTNQQTTSNRVHQTGYQQGTNQQTTSNRVHQTSYQQGTNQQPQSSSSQLASNQQVKSAADQNYNNYGNSEIQAKYQSQPENLNNNNNGQAYQSQTFNSNGVPQYQTTKKPEQQSTHSVNNYKTIVPQYQTTNQPELLLNIKNHETLSTYQQLQTTSKPFVNEVSKSSDFTLQNDSPTPGLNDPLRGSSIKPAGSTYATIKLQENYQTNPTVAPITRSNNDLNQNSQTSPDILQSINSLSTPLVASTSAPQYRQTGPHNTVFTVKVKPETKDYSFLELHRQYNDVNRVTTPVPPVTTPYFSGTSVTITPSTNHSTQPKSQQASSYQPDSVPNQYASYNDSGRKEEIRPELINSLIDNGVTPTSAKALHSLASYYGSVESLEDTSSTSLNNLEKDESGFNDESTLTPLTSTHSLDKLPSILTKQTKDSYLHLFSDSKEQQYEHYNDNDEDDDLIAKQSGRLVEELVEQDLEELDADEKQSKFRDSSELRELAQVFSRALSAYLEDPDTFKEILAQVRPTEPNLDVTTPSPEDEVLDFSDAHRENRGKSTVAPKTTILDTPVDIDQINSLVSNFESIKKQTTVKPTSSAYVNNNGGTKTTTPSGRYIGSSDTSSYFPTAGSVSDTTRPRYGGFHNNTRRLPKNYSPYGAGLPTNITGIPLKLVSTTAAPFINSINYTDFKIPLRVISEAHRVNSNSFSASSEEASESFKSNDNEKLLIPSSSQSLVTSGNNYLKFAQNFHQANKQIHSKDSRNEQQELLPYFGQQPPFESFDEPTGFQTQNPKLDVEANFIPAVNLSHHRESKFNHNISDETDRSMPVTEHATTILQATTYHPLHSSSEQPLSTINTEPTTMTPDVTYTQNEFETTLDNEKISSQTTFGPDHPNYNNLIKERAKEMFGMLNETTAGMLMNMINQAESNITIRRLVLLLVADNSKENKTAEESRFSLIRALLNNEGVSSESTEATTTTAPTTTTTSVPTTTGSNWRAHSSKSYRGTDSQTAVAGGKLQSAELNNKINSAKLYIPSASSSSSAKLPYDSDARAVELLKTLYTLAAKWG
ncbi:hypothetical protein O3M35_000442 [Rhynocoris fuscipes]|uniref:Uncharacterized protein n=1 Tax=Rhynocoris fuscipes TaxID=488301 RepID=A0AAW1DSM8_9HEMI